MLVQTNHHGYVKDTASGTIINNNEEEYKKFLANREASKRSNSLQTRIQLVESGLNETKSELQEIKNLLLQIVNRNGTN